ncbi:hypothetical protein TRIUR3_11077 [Triticum urartu]|uniref:F-box domain-containing protein n=1 Tax=Triticum urartu TaxID=4572 RepID=M7YH36_TRIUA|nr:hypothetical protein TRIUR3_11077 [Triticum urartu]
MEEAGSDDRISGLSDDLLRDILLRLHSLPAAARTTILSRRWRHVWTSIPELVIDELHVHGRPPSSLRRLGCGAGCAQRLGVAAPMLEVLVASFLHHAHISAPRLAEAKVQRLHRHHFADDVPRRLRRLDITQLYLNAAAPPRARRFDAVDELRLSALIGMEGYTSFLDDVNNLPVCQTVLSVSLTGDHHGFVPTMLHLLRRSNAIKKLVLETYAQTGEVLP